MLCTYIIIIIIIIINRQHLATGYSSVSYVPSVLTVPEARPTTSE